MMTLDVHQLRYAVAASDHDSCWMRMFPIPNQSSVGMAWKEFDEAGRMEPSSYYDRIVEVIGELLLFTVLLRLHAAQLVDRESEWKSARMPVDQERDFSMVANRSQALAL